MKKSLSVAYLFIVIAPLVLVCWLGWHSIVAEQARYQSRLRELQEERLQEFSNNQLRWLESLETSLIQFLESIQREPYSSWPALQQQNRFAYQLFAMDSDGQFTWPDKSILPLLDKELHFLDMYQEGVIRLSPENDEQGGSRNYYNWTSWFEGHGQQWAFWLNTPDGGSMGMVLDRTAFISEAIAQLPDSVKSSRDTNPYRRGSLLPAVKKTEERFTLINEAGEILYSWGAEIPDSSQAPPVESLLPSPLNMWKFQLMWPKGTTPPFYRQPLLLFMATGILGLFIITLGAAYYLYSQTRREFEQARKRVSFVNQVSHEFKTPLTNIQLYSDLLEDEIGTATGNKYLNIIREESRKLNRMIQNVLTFGRSQRAALQLNPVSMVPDAHISEQLDIHRPGLERMGLNITFTQGANQAMLLDQECLSQILGNLLSNAEKYAPGSSLTIQTNQSGTRLTVRVKDSGPGITRSEHDSVFEPFVRLENSTSEGISGTGIGLSIARDLARLHGGDLVLEESESGACFTFNLVEPS